MHDLQVKVSNITVLSEIFSDLAGLEDVRHFELEIWMCIGDDQNNIRENRDLGRPRKAATNSRLMVLPRYNTEWQKPSFVVWLLLVLVLLSFFFPCQLKATWALTFFLGGGGR